MEDLLIGGFKPAPLTARDRRFSISRNFGVASLDLPRRFYVNKKGVHGPRQQGRNLCSAYTLSEIGSNEHGIPMSAEFQAMAISLIEGRAIHLDGAQMRNAMKSGQSFGFLPDKFTPFRWEEKGEAFICDSKNWSWELVELARQYRMRGGYFIVDGPYDAFDNMRANLYQHRRPDQDNDIALGIPWYRSFNRTPDSGKIPEPDTLVGWHAIDLNGFDVKFRDGEEVVRVRSWDGKRFGDNSYAYFTRERFNKVMKVPGAIALMYKDAPEDLIKALKEEKETLQEALLTLYYQWLFFKQHGVWRS